MRLKHVSLKNYRAFESVEFDVPASGVVIVVGPNNSGKTAFLSAIDIVAGVKPGERIVRAGATDAEVTATFELSDNERTALIRDSQTADQWLGSPGLTEITFTWHPRSVNEAFLSGIHIMDGNGVFQAIATMSANTPASNDELSLVALDTVLQQPPHALNFARSSASGGFAREELLARVEIALLYQLLQEWRERYYHFEALRTGTTRTTPSHGATRLSPTGSDLPQALLHLYTRNDPAWHRVVAIMQDVVPDVGVLTTPVEGAEVEVAFHDPHLQRLQNIKDLGTGVEQLLMTAYVGVRQPQGGMVLIEEPETNLHPAAQRALLRHVREWSRERVFVLASHSTIFLDETMGENRVLLVERSAGIATIQDIEGELQDVLLSLGVRLSDVLSAERVVLVEGKIDAEVLRAWFPDLTITRGVAIAPMEGGDQAWHVDILPRLLDAADKLDRTPLAFRDRDELPDAAVERFERQGLVHVFDRRELENYLLDLPAIRRVLDRQAADNPSRQPAKPEADIEQVLREQADLLRDQVVLKRVVATIRTIRLVDRAAVSEILDAGPSLERLLEVVKARLRAEDELIAEITETWRRIESETRAEWEDRWREIAPGAELLEAVWHEHGGSFEKGRDGVMIAREMNAPPDELSDAIAARFCGETSNS